MSRENVESVRELAETLVRGDPERAFDFYDPDIEWDMRQLFVRGVEIGDLAAVYHGHEGVRAFWRGWLQVWSKLEFEVDDVLDAGDAAVLLIRDHRAAGRHSGVAVEMPPYGWVFSFSGNRVDHVRYFPDHGSALKAAGLSEGGVPTDTVVIARQVLDAVSHLDLDRLRELTAPDVRWRSFFAAMSGAGEYKGHEGLAEYVEDLGESWDLIRPEPDDMLAVGEVVLAVGRIHYRGKESGAEEEVPAGWLFGMRDGKVTSFNAFNDPEKALAGLGSQ